ncbi:MAG: hypothetical protein M3Y37_09500 [Chloroflexota bacterium]|nr:hypothetical protein [Chloroflexota bacterium]
MGFAARLDEFLAEPSARLTLNNGRDSGGREYGGFILGEHLQQRFGTGALVDLLETADQWGDVNLSEVYAELLGSKGSSFATEITHFWQSAYLMESQFGVGFTDEGAQDPAGSSDKLQGVWREVLRAHDSATPDGRADHLDIHVLDELQSSEGTAEIGAGGAAFFELHKPYYGGDANWTITTESENVRAFVISMADVDSLDACDFPVEMDINHEGPQLLGEAGLPINSVCPVSTLVVVNVGGPGDDSVDLNWRVRLAPSNATMSTSKIEIGFTEQGNLIDAVAAYPKPMLGLRLKGDADAEVLGWAIPGEGWGIGEPGDPYHSGGVSWNHGMDETTAVTFRRDSPTSITSEVVIQDEFIVEHHFHPSPNPYLIQIDVSIHTRSGNGPTPTDVYYRRVFDWDIPPDQFTEYSTIAVKPGEDAPYLAHASDDGFADPDPEEPRTMIDASGLFADVGPADNGALIELALGSFEDETYKEFTIYYGAAPTEEIALQALDTVPAQLYSLGQHNAGDGTPVTGIFAVDGSSLPSGAGPENATLSALEGDSPHEVLTVDRASEQAALRQEPEG